MNKLLFTTVAAVGLSLGALSIASPNILKDVPTSDSVKSTMKKALNKDSRNPLERPLAERTNAPRQVSNPLGPDAEEYLLVGYSMFDFSLPEEEQNVFGAGGKLCSYPVYISMDKDSGKVKAYNLINLSSDKEQIPAYGIFDKESNQIRFSTNPYFYETEETVVISQKGNEYIILQAGDPMGAGYWQDANELVINISNDGKVLTPVTGFGAFSYTYDDYWEEFNQSALHDIMFNTHLYKKAEGVNILASENSVNLGQSFLGETKSAKVSIINTGNEESDFVVKLSGEGFSCNTKTGSLEPGASNELTIEFTPDLEGTFTGEIIVQNEGEDVRILLSGTGIKYPDFTRIVSKNADLISFSTSNDYPWIIREDIINGPVAATTNKGVDNSKSSLTLNIEIPEGKKGVLNWGGFYDPFYGTRDEFSITDNDIEIYCTPLKHQIGEVDGKINLLSGHHEVVFTYSKDMAVYPQGVEFGNDLVWLKNLSLDVETYTPQAASIENNEVDFNRFFLVTKEVAYEIEQPVLINEGYENLNILEIIPDGVFNAKADKNTLKPEERLKLRVSFNATSVGKYEGTVLIKTSAGDLPISCKLNVEEAPDYSSIIKEGEFLFVPDNQYPFTVEKGVAYNSTSMVEDSVETLSILTAFFNVPDDKYGKLTWMGKVDTQGNGYEVDKGMIMVDNNAYGMHYYHGHDDAGHYSVEPYEVYFNPGTHLISWAYQQCGDKKSYGLDRMSVSELSIEYLDKLPKLEVWEKLPIDMKDVYEGHKNTRSVNIANLSYNIASFRQSDGNDNFSLYVDEEMNSEIPAFGKGSIEIDFHPIEAGIISEELKLQTSKGELSIPVMGVSMSTVPATFIEDFENGISDWNVIDVNDDKYFWHDETYGTYARTGLGSAVCNSVFADDMDDYLVSPKFIVPENNAEVSWWRCYTKEWNNTYDLLIGEGEDPTAFEKVFTDEGHSQFEFEQIKVDLSKYAGKKVRIAFHNRTNDGRASVLIIDDVAVYDNNFSGVKTIFNSNDILSTEYWTPDGIRLPKPEKGVIIVKTVLKDGRTEGKKCIIK